VPACRRGQQRGNVELARRGAVVEVMRYARCERRARDATQERGALARARAVVHLKPAPVTARRPAMHRIGVTPMPPVSNRWIKKAGKFDCRLVAQTMRGLEISAAQQASKSRRPALP
jgi:hypothetical protein